MVFIGGINIGRIANAEMNAALNKGSCFASVNISKTESSK